MIAEKCRADTQEEALELSQKIYVHFGFIAVGFRYSSFGVGEIVTQSFEDEYLNSYRWRVVGESSFKEAQVQLSFVGIRINDAMQWRKFYRLEAMD